MKIFDADDTSAVRRPSSSGHVCEAFTRGAGAVRVLEWHERGCGTGVSAARAGLSAVQTARGVTRAVWPPARRGWRLMHFHTIARQPAANGHDSAGGGGGGGQDGGRQRPRTALQSISFLLYSTLTPFLRHSVL